MTFIQVIDYTTDRGEEIERVLDQWREATDGRRSTASAITCRDRDRPDHYVTIVEFSSFEQAMETSKMPETQQFANRMTELCKGEPQFLNLDEIRRDKA
ncbi:MAG: hypothetical protein M3070_10040 [Actinomycetota bacterium]|nr:hypothetical protein [Actinomycetota bacterium]